MMAVDLSPFLAKQNSIEQDFAAKMAANTFSRGLSQQRGSRAVTDYTRGFQRALPKFTSSYGRRGLAGGGIQSGVFQNAMQNYVGDYTRNLGQLQQGVFDANRQFDFNAANYESARQSALADLEAQKAALIAQTAQHIAALKPYLGG